MREFLFRLSLLGRFDLDGFSFFVQNRDRLNPSSAKSKGFRRCSAAKAYAKHYKKWCYGVSHNVTGHKDTTHNDTSHNDTSHKVTLFINDTIHRDISHNSKK